MISIKDYAARNNVTYEAVRQQVKRYSTELEEHIKRDGRQQFLDDYAVAFLDERRQKNPVVILQADKDAELEALRRERESLLIKIAAQADKISELAEWKSDNALLLAEAKSQQALLQAAEQRAHSAEGALDLAITEKLEAVDEKNAIQEKLTSAELEAEAAKQRAAELEAEKAAIQEKFEALQKRGFWARLFNKE